MLRINLLHGKLKYACFLIGVLIGIHLQASPVDTVTAKTVVTNFYTRNYAVKNVRLSLVYTEKSAGGEAEYYIYNVYSDGPGGQGFIIVSADDAANPIIGYSSEGSLLACPFLSPDFTFWMQHYKKQIAAIRLNKIAASEDIQNEWTAYKSNLPLKSSQKITGSVSPLLKTVWQQGQFYNASCPDTCVAGCVATAMGQIMKYWAYPPHGIGQGSYTDAPYGVLYANYDTSRYNWAAMPNNVTENNAPVATLMYDCGVSVEMEYSPENSGSYMIYEDYPVSSQTAFVARFGYNGSTIQGLYMDDYSSSAWISLLENELNNKRPFQYAGSGDSGSHSWVCDGYDATNYFHMNWGWGGYADGYFKLSALNPDNLPFSSGEEALIGIEPAHAVADFNANTAIIRAGDTVRFLDNSFGSAPITAWQWSFPGAMASLSSVQNPMAIYNSPGIYTVSETVASSQGNSTLTRQEYIVVLANNTVNVYPTLSDGSFTIQLEDASLAASNLTFSLYNTLGQKVYSTALVQYMTQVSITVPHGMYFFRAFDASGKPVSTGKLMMK